MKKKIITIVELKRKKNKKAKENADPRFKIFTFIR